MSWYGPDELLYGIAREWFEREFGITFVEGRRRYLLLKNSLRKIKILKVCIKRRLAGISHRHRRDVP